jgi:Xaa-Pro aminopeptidase
MMREDNLAGLLLARNPHVFYVTGTRFVFVRSDAPMGMSPQTTALITPDRVVYCQRFGAFDTEETAIDTAWADDIEFYDDEMDLVDILRKYGVSKGGKIGTEWGSGLCVGINPAKFLTLKDRIRMELGAEVVDGTTTIWKATAVKSSYEISQMRVAVNAACLAMEEVFGFVEIGMNLMDVSRQARVFMLQHGADTVTHAQVLIEDGGPRLGSCDAVDRDIKAGYFHMDLGCTYRRYGSDIHRGIFLGREPSSDEEKLYECRVGVSELMDKMIKPGACMDDVLVAVDQYVKQRGCEVVKPQNEIFAGHSIGLEVYQGAKLAPSSMQPEFQDKDGRVLFEPGMMFTYEMAIRMPGSKAFFNIEDDVLVTTTGVENMSSIITRDLRVKMGASVAAWA